MDNLQVADRVDRACRGGMMALQSRRGVSSWSPLTLDVDDILVCKGANHVEDAVDGGNVGQERVTQPGPLGGALYQSSNVSDGQHGRNDALRLVRLDEVIKAFVGHGDARHVRVDGAKLRK